MIPTTLRGRHYYSQITYMETETHRTQMTHSLFTQLLLRVLGFLKNSDIPQKLSQMNIIQTKHLISALCNNSPSPEQTLLPPIPGARCLREAEGNQTIPTQASYPARHQIVSLFTADRHAPGWLLLHPAAEHPAGPAPQSFPQQLSRAQPSEQLL